MKATKLGPLHDGHARQGAILACPVPATPCTDLSVYSAKLHDGHVINGRTDRGHSCRGQGIKGSVLSSRAYIFQNLIAASDNHTMRRSCQPSPDSPGNAVPADYLEQSPRQAWGFYGQLHTGRKKSEGVKLVKGTVLPFTCIRKSPLFFRKVPPFSTSLFLSDSLSGPHKLALVWIPNLTLFIMVHILRNLTGHSPSYDQSKYSFGFP